MLPVGVVIHIGGLVGQRIGLDGAVGVELHLCSGEQLAPGGVLADAVKDRIRLGGLGPGVVKRGGKAALSIFDGQALVEANGTLEEMEEMGKRKLAYEINYISEGYYVLVKFTSGPDFPAELDRVLGITDGILRSLITRRPE